MIGTYLRRAHEKEIYLTAVIYLQFVTESRIHSSTVKNLQLLKLLCGKQFYGNILLVTVGWTIPPKATHVRLETDWRTRDILWGDLLKIGATYQRHTRGRESALNIVHHVLGKTPSVLQFQLELARVGIIGKTSAGDQLITEIVKEQESEKRVIESFGKMHLEKSDERRNLEHRLKELNQNLAVMATEIENLNTPLQERIRRDNRLQELGQRNGRRPQCAVQ